MYQHSSISELIKYQCFQRGNEPDGLRNMEEFSKMTLPLVALACTVVRVPFPFVFHYFLLTNLLY